MGGLYINSRGIPPILPPGVSMSLTRRDLLQGAAAAGAFTLLGLDASGQFPRHVGASAALLADHAHRYIYISSISCYKEPSPMYGDEDSPLAVLADPTVE